MPHPTRILLFVPLILTATPAFCEDWNPQLAANFLDSRQKAWQDWAPTKAPGGPCVSCHTGSTYLLARPALRAALGQAQPTEYETNLLTALRSRAPKTTAKEVFPGFTEEPKASQALGVESIHAALLLAADDQRRGTFSDETRKAFERMWSFQQAEGKSRGAWAWFSLKLDPWEMPESAYYGAALAALAVGSTPGSYQSSPQVRPRLAALSEYLMHEEPSQPLHNRLMALWASTRLPDVLTSARRERILRDVVEAQQPDGGWTLESLGPWNEHPAAASSKGSNAYATAVAACVLVKAGNKTSNQATRRALAWLRTHQSPEDGSWRASSMNKQYPAGSMQESFMSDAATAFAVLALTSR